MPHPENCQLFTWDGGATGEWQEMVLARSARALNDLRGWILSWKQWEPPKDFKQRNNTIRSAEEKDSWVFPFLSKDLLEASSVPSPALAEMRRAGNWPKEGRRLSQWVPRGKNWGLEEEEGRRMPWMVGVEWVSQSHSVQSNLWPHGLQSPCNSPGHNTGVGSHSLLQGIFPIQGSNPGLPHCSQIIYQLIHQGSSWWVWTEWKSRLGISLVVQWPRIWLAMHGTQVQSLIGELRSCMHMC